MCIRLAADVHEFEAVVTNTTKPLVFIGYSPRGVELVYEMAAEVAGGLDALQLRPFLHRLSGAYLAAGFPRRGRGSDVHRRRPAHAPDSGAERADRRNQPGDDGRHRSPIDRRGADEPGPGPAPQTGRSVLLERQHRRIDMRTALLSLAAPEVSLGLAAQAEVAQSFGLPTWGLAGATDSKALDAQAGIESAFHILAQGLAGLNLIHDVGYMDSGMVCSAEMLVMGNEVIGMAKRFIQGIRVDAETLARDVIEKVGPGGHYLQEKHTVRHMRDELWMPGLLTRQHRDVWKAEGAKDMAQRVGERVRDLVESHQVPPLPDKTLAALERLRREGEAELTKK